MSMTKNDLLPVLPLRDMAPQPGTTLPMFVGREKSKNAVKAAVTRKTPIILVSQKTISIEQPSPGDLYGVGILGEINQVLEHPDGTIRIVVTSKARGYLRDIRSADASDAKRERAKSADASVAKLRSDESYIEASFEEIKPDAGREDAKKATRDVNKIFGTYCKVKEDDMLAESRRLLGRLNELQTQIQALRVAGEAMQQIADPNALADMVPGYIHTQVQPEKLGDPETIKALDNRIRAKQAILSEPDPVKRLQLLRKFIEDEFKRLER